MKRLLPVLLLLTACSSSPDAAPPDPEPPTSWLAMAPGDGRVFAGDAGELTLIHVDETYAVGGSTVSAITYEHDDTYVTDFFLEEDGTIWCGRRGEWRAGRDGETPREVPVDGDVVRFDDIAVALSDDGPTRVETPDGVFTESP